MGLVALMEIPEGMGDLVGRPEGYLFACAHFLIPDIHRDIVFGAFQFLQDLLEGFALFTSRGVVQNRLVGRGGIAKSSYAHCLSIF